LDFGFGTYLGHADITEYLAVANPYMSGNLLYEQIQNDSKYLVLNRNSWFIGISIKHYPFNKEESGMKYSEVGFTFKECSVLLQSYHV